MTSVRTTVSGVWLVAEMCPDPGQHHRAHQGFGQQLIDEGPVIGVQFDQGQGDLISDGQLGSDAMGILVVQDVSRERLLR